ncbi:efflux transporter periplasmic adaptor subunit [Methylobacterium radiodurans]|uniref:Efflux transporter periplasmic adaptor subunit n=2 Tax=Methylobacterium radiodurans TaxID=2202828 RepID=A0A2U8VW32_9HYPH|nr:efflux RND transporter periplasmic adaptor subunit [Methylobacterium radiodurans]AWN38059.1 efflux transporter periplasmic adaptor subunit [Methylobacterium radiodurans]
MADEDDPKAGRAAEPGAAGTPDAEPPALREKRSPRGGRARKLLRIGATAAILILALAAAAVVWHFYVTAPWTRDGRVRVQVAAVAPQVSGQIVALKVVDNQAVKRGDVLYRIDPFDFEVAVAQAEAEVKNREADLQVKNAQSARRQALTTVSTSVEEKQQYAGTAKIAEAALETAKAQLSQAQINLKRTEVRAPVNGRVTNLLLREGDYATTGTVNVRVVDTDSFWIDGYFEETKMANIHVNDPAEMQLMGFEPALKGTVESITLGIATANASTSTQGLPNVDPVYTWVRLAQRVPVRIRIDHVPEGVPLVAGMTATVVVNNGVGSRPAWFADLGRTIGGTR